MIDGLSIAIKIFIVLAPFTVLSVFVALTEHLSVAERKRIAIQSTIAIFIAAFTIYFFGEYILNGLGLQLRSFRIGGGLVLLLSGIEMVRGSIQIRKSQTEDGDAIAVVPIAIPSAIGPGTVGALLVMGNDLSWEKAAIDAIGIICAIFLVGFMLYNATWIEHLVKRRGVTILSKLSGLFIAALAAQIIMEGIKEFFPNL